MVTKSHGHMITWWHGHLVTWSLCVVMHISSSHSAQLVLIALPHVHAPLRPPVPHRHHVICAQAYQLRNTLYYERFHLKEVNAKLGSMTWSWIRYLCNMIYRAMGRQGAPIYQPLLKV